MTVRLTWTSPTTRDASCACALHDDLPGRQRRASSAAGHARLTSGTMLRPLTDDGGPLMFPTWQVASSLALTVFVAPLWPWSRGWTWAPAGMLAMGVAGIVLFSFTIIPA
jgi:hypothetical protein